MHIPSAEQTQPEPGLDDVSPRPAASPPRGPFGTFYGWWMVAIAAGVQFLAGGFYQVGFSVYFLPISRDLGLSRAAMSLAFSLRSLEGGLDGPLVGYLVDRMGPRFMIRAGGLFTGLGFILLAFTNDYLSFLLVFLGLIVIGINSGVALPTATLVNHWFARQRTLAVTLSHIGVEIGGTLVTPLLALLVLNYGWRQAAMVSGIVFLAIVPVLAWFVRNTPESMGFTPDGDPPRPKRQNLETGGAQTDEPADFTVRDALHTRTFWHLATAIGARQFGKQSLMVHLIPLLVWKGIEEPIAAVLLALFAFAQVPLRIVSATIADRWSMTKVSSLAALAGVGAVVVLLQPEGFLAFGLVGTGVVFALLFALAETGNSPGWAVIGEFFGRSRYATIRGSVGFVQSAVSLPAPVIAGWVYDTTQSYTLALIPVGAAYLTAAILFWVLRRPAQPAESSANTGASAAQVDFSK